MHPPEKLEQMRLERLHAETDTIHPTGAVGGKVSTVHGSGVGFQSNFAGRLDTEQRGCAFENAPDARRLKGRRSSAAEEDRLEAPGAPIIHRGIEIQLLKKASVAVFFWNFPNHWGVTTTSAQLRR